QKKEVGEGVITTVLFDHEQSTLHDRKDVKDISPLTTDDYTVRGSTALMDAVGDAIEKTEMIHKYLPDSYLPEKTLFIITTDGMENASRRFTAPMIKRLIGQKKACGWEFLFLGANIDAEKTASEFGIGKDRAVTYRSDSVGTNLNYEVMSDTISELRAKRALPTAWKERIEKRR
ncbi:MAG: hypothetical protein IIX93_03520, partial [Clostridia bacterium]|nr:hypothetical protein [Clostridia bacterium]